MEQGQYYMSEADNIYGMMRKSFIYVTKVCRRVFFYKYIDDWQFVEVNGQTKLKLNGQGKGNFRGKLKDGYCFMKLHKDVII